MNLSKSALVINFSLIPIVCVIVYFLGNISFDYIQYNLTIDGISIFTNKVNESLFSIIKIYYILFAMLYLPILMMNVYLYIKDALYHNEKKLAFSVILSYSFGLLGAILGYFLSVWYVIPIFYNYNLNLGVESTVSLASVIDFVLFMAVLFFFVFQVPLIVKSLIKFNVLSKNQLRYNRKHFFLFALVFSGVIGGADLLTFFLVPIIMQVLYEISIW